MSEDQIVRLCRPLRVYVSYERADTVRLERFVPALRGAGCDVWMDEGNVHNNYRQFERRMHNAIRECDVLVVTLSPAAVGSRWVQRETTFARQLLKPVVPVLVRDVELPDHLKDIHAFDLHDAERLDEQTARLIAALNMASRQIS